MGGFAALIGGAGQGAQNWNAQAHQQRILDLSKWGQVQNHLADMIAQARQSSTTPERQVELDQLRSKVLGMRPGEDPTKVLQDVQEHLTLHPVAQAALARPQQKEPIPGPTPLGQPAGTGGNALASMIGQGTGGSSDASAPSQTPSAAQPQTSPVSPAAQGGGAQSSSQPSSAPAIAPVPQQSPDLGSTVRNDYSSALASGTMPAALQTAAQPFLTNTAELDRTRMLDQYLLKELGPQRMQAIMQQTPNWDQLPAYIKAGYAASSMGVPAISVPGIAMRPVVINPNAPGSSAPQGQTEANGQPINRAQGTVYRIERDPFNGTDLWYPVNAPTTVTQTAGGEQISNRLSGASIAPVEGAVPPAQNAFNYGAVQGVGEGGHTNLNTRGRVLQGLPSFDTGFTPPAMLPHTTSSTTSVPGQLPQTTNSIRSVTPPASDGGHIPSIHSSGGGGSNNSLIQRKYEDWAGGGPAPTGKDLTAVQQYMSTHSLPTPIQLSATGQKQVTSLDQVLGQIATLKQKMEAAGYDKDDSRGYYSDYIAYAHGLGVAKHQDIWTNLSFERLRSAAAAMTGMNSRAYQIIDRALAHTPDPEASFSKGKLPDPAKTMYGKLNEMENILKQGREQVINDDRKSGTVPPVGGSAPGVEEWIRDSTGKLVKK